VSNAQAQSQRPPAIDASRLPAELVSLTAEEVARIARMAPVAPFPSDPTNRFADDERAAELGHRLFFDTRISPKGVSCATCHDPAKHFTDGLPLARGIGVTTRNAPTVVDSGRRRWVGWDGKFDSLWSQALAPIENPVEMGSSRERLQQVVRDDATLRALYEGLFGAMPEAPSDIATANLLKSLGAYQRKLVSGPAPIDRFIAGLRGDPSGDRRQRPERRLRPERLDELQGGPADLDERAPRGRRGDEGARGARGQPRPGRRLAPAGRGALGSQPRLLADHGTL
jgi:cytochrome c peroxidase